MIRLLLLALTLLTLPLAAQPDSLRRPLTIDDIQELPDTTFRLAFHFVGLPDGRNFVVDPADSLLAAHGDNEKLRADVLMGYLLRELNYRYRTALLDYPDSRDTKLRFAYAAGPERPLESAYFYAHGERPRRVPGAFNVILTTYRGRGKPNGATTGVGSDQIFLYNNLQSYLAGSVDTWTPARILAHEIGHALSLDHTFKCDNPCAGQGFDPAEECFGNCVGDNYGSGPVNCFGGSQRELMMGYGTQLYLTTCEVERIWNYLLRDLPGS